jgi:hypothetical protein
MPQIATLESQKTALSRSGKGLRHRVVHRAVAPLRVARSIRMHPVSGLPCDITPAPFVSDEQIKTALAGFP